MYRYMVTGTGALKTQKGAYEVPTKTQGLLVTNNHFIYSTSLGNDNRSNIYVVAGGARDIDILFDRGGIDMTGFYRVDQRMRQTRTRADGSVVPSGSLDGRDVQRRCLIHQGST